MHGNEDVLMDLTLLKKLIAYTVVFSCFYDEKIVIS